MANIVVGGGPKKVLYTLNTVRRIGLTKVAKALNAKNACKACGLGMGGQMGGMTNEIGEFPSVCNKSVQAQSTDIQPAIPEEIFSHPVAELDELSAKEMEHLGRLTSPVFKSADSNKLRPVDWDFAMTHMARHLQETDPERSFFYSSGRSSNEAGFLFQLLARAYGTNNVTNCSYYCHQATSVAMEEAIGTGTAMTGRTRPSGFGQFARASFSSVRVKRPSWTECGLCYRRQPFFQPSAIHSSVEIGARSRWRCDYHQSGKGTWPRQIRGPQEPDLHVERRRRNRVPVSATANRNRCCFVQRDRQGPVGRRCDRPTVY